MTNDGGPAFPNYSPLTQEVEMSRPARRFSQAAPYPPIMKHDDGRLIVDEYALTCRVNRRNHSTGRFYSTIEQTGHCVVKLWERADHPSLMLLPPNAPRAVKALYRAEGQLAFIRGDYGLAIKAFDAWSEFCAMIDLTKLKLAAASEPNNEHFVGQFEWSPTGQIWRSGRQFAIFYPAAMLAERQKGNV